MSEPELICSCWTHAGDAASTRGDELSPFAVLDRVSAVAEAGWQGIGLARADLVAARESIGYPVLAKAIRDAGLTYVEVEFLGDWWTTGAVRARSDAHRRDLLDAASELGAQTIKVSGSLFEPVDDMDRMREEFDALATEAASRDTRIALEAMPFANFSTVGESSDFVASVGNSHGGLVVDIWHLYRAGELPSDLRESVDPRYIFAVELNDAREPAPPHDQLFDDTIDNRELPGQGSWDVPGFIREVKDLGFDGPWGVEILSAAHRRRSLADQVRESRDATLRMF